MKHVLFISSSNTCRSPIAMTVLQQLLAERELQSLIAVDSAALDCPTWDTASDGARKTITATYGSDLLAQYRTKRISDTLLASADLILTMEEGQTRAMEASRTFALRSYAGSSGDIDDPAFSQDYEDCIKDVRSCLEAALPTLLLDLAVDTNPSD
ncbi:MAG: hypothetical protein JW846_03930 [Dehalococcoidia bacterium]|nr:hypothetical protein [Dehalococcoidia bacterium]